MKLRWCHFYSNSNRTAISWLISCPGERSQYGILSEFGFRLISDEIQHSSSWFCFLALPDSLSCFLILSSSLLNEEIGYIRERVGHRCRQTRCVLIVLGSDRWIASPEIVRLPRVSMRRLSSWTVLESQAAEPLGLGRPEPTLGW
jgi:hypothetical protein